MSGQEQTQYDVRRGAAWITLNRPEARNALSAVLVKEVCDHLAAASADSNVRAIVITGKGSAFCAGADLKSPPDQRVEDQGRVPTYPDLLNSILEHPKPVVVAVNGAAFAGGLGLLGAADIVVTVDDVQMSFSEVRIGVIPAVISVVCIPKLGLHHAMKLFLTGERFDGKQAVNMGLAHRAVPAAELDAAVQEEIAMISLGGPNAIKEAKRLVREAFGLAVRSSFEVAGTRSKVLFGSEEAAEGIAAFREKRKPKWAVEGESCER
jgi:enoyl-CoA hydratase/carnithine racemase